MELRGSQMQLRDAENKLQDIRDKFQKSQNALQDTRDKLQDSQKQLESSRNKFQDSQEKSQDSHKRLQYSQKLLQNARKTLQESQEQLQDSQEKFEESQEQIRGSQKVIQKSQEQLEGYERTVGELKILLFETYGKAKQYDKVEKIFYDILDNQKETIPLETLLAMKYSYAEQLHEQGDPVKAKEIAEDVWNTRKMLDSVSENPRAMSEKTKESHRQICSIYTSLQDFDAAEYEQRLVYQGVPRPKDDWMLENGDALAITLMKRKKYEEAALLRLDVWKERRQPANQGLWDSCTLRSALMCISFLKEIVEDISKTLSEHGRSEEEQDDVRHRMQWHERNILKMLQEVWRVPESRPEILEVGHELGSRLIAGRKYADAEAILNYVWEARTALYPEANQLTMSTGRILVDAIKLQESPGRYERAASSCRRILDKAKPMFGEDNDWVISVGTTLAEMLFLDENYAGPDGAEGICRWVLEQKEKKLDQADPQLDDARYKLGKAIHAQGRERYAGLPHILQDVYDRWNNSLPKPSATVECGRMLVKAYEDLAALDPIRALFEGRGPVSEKDMLYLESGHLLGKLLLNQRNWEGAGEVLRLLWDYQADLLEEQRIRLWCGQLYGQSLLRRNQHRLAKEVLESVELAQRAQPDIFGEGSTEGEQFAESLRRVSREMNAPPQGRRGRILRQRR